MLPALAARLRTSGQIGGYLADLLQIMSWVGVTVTLAGTALVALSASVLHWATNPAVYASAGTFLFFLWTFVAIAVLRDRQKIKTVRIAHDYAYSLIIDGGWQQPVIGKFEATHPNHPNENALVLVMTFRNVGAGPLRLRVEEARIVLGGMTNDFSPTEFIFARMAPKGVRPGAIKLDLNKPQQTGTATFKFVYGPPDGEFVRRYFLRLDIQLNLDMENHAVMIQDSIKEETDIPYVTG